MADFPTIYSGNGATTTFSVPWPYLNQSHVIVKLAGVVQTLGTHYTFPSSGQIQFVTAPPTGVGNVSVDRVTPLPPIVEFTSGPLLASDLNSVTQQAQYGLEELDAQVRTVEALGATAIQPGDVKLLPSGGAAGRVLRKVTGSDYDVAWTSADGLGDLLAANNLSELADPATALANLGGVSKTADEVITGLKTFQTALSATTSLRLEAINSDAQGGPQFDLARVSASPAASDIIGVIRIRGMNSAAAEVTYANINATILDPTAGSEDGRLILQVPVAGVQTSALGVASGVVIGAPTGSYTGTGTINASGYYLDGVALSATLFGVDVGSSSGNLKALNSAGALTFTTTETNENVAGVNVGVWKTAHRIDSYDAATYAGNRATMAILRGFAGSGENGPTRSDTALHLEAEQDDWLNTTVLGESDTLRVFMRKGANGDAAGMLLNVSKVESASYGSLVWEAASSWVQAAAGTILRQVRTSTGHQGPAADLRGGGTGFHSAASVGDNGIAYLASQNGGRWGYAFLGADGYLNGEEYFYVTGPAHASGKGRVRTSSGSAALPAFSFVDDPNTGLLNTSADTLALVTGGTARLSVTTALVSLTLPLSVNSNTVVDASAGVVFRGYSQAAIASAANAVNTTDKVAGKSIWDTTNSRILTASGATATSPWIVANGTTAITPA